MTDYEILEKVICKVKGYPYGCIVYPEDVKNRRYYFMIFDIEFAKIFWGDSAMDSGCDFCVIVPSWKYHLQQMVLEKEPLKYLEKYL